MNNYLQFLLLVIINILVIGCDNKTYSNNFKNNPKDALQIIIIRHAEKPTSGGDNLSCQGQNRAHLLPELITKKFGQPAYIYVPALKSAKSSAHSRMFQTATPIAIKYDVAINSKYNQTDFVDVAHSVLEKNGTVLMVWSHGEIPALAKALGIDSALDWGKKDFDSIWRITFEDGKATLSKDIEGLNPLENCNF